jgi:hypothetical protein
VSTHCHTHSPTHASNCLRSSATASSPQCRPMLQQSNEHARTRSRALSHSHSRCLLAQSYTHSLTLTVHDEAQQCGKYHTLIRSLSLCTMTHTMHAVGEESNHDELRCKGRTRLGNTRRVRDWCRGAVPDGEVVDDVERAPHHVCCVAFFSLFLNFLLALRNKTRFVL